VVASRIDQRTLESLNYSTQDTKLLGFAASNIVKETMEHALSQPIEVVRDGEHLVLVCNGKYEWLEEKLVQGLARVQANFRNYLKVSASIGISGEAHADLYALHEAYREALEALELRFFRGAGRHYFYRDTTAPRGESGGLPDSRHSVEHLKLEQSAVDNLRAGLYAELLNDTESWLAALQSDDIHSQATITVRTASYLGRMLQHAQEREPDNVEWFRQLESLSEEIARIETMEEVAGFVYRKIRLIIEALNPQKTPKRKVQQALDYIEENYQSSGLSLAGVGQALFVSSTYLSTLFKQELGVNFLDYVHQYRIERAKALLQTGDVKIQTVAREVGYFDEAHFTKTFKKWTGMLPSQYKKETAYRS
jgi:two-component system, response regulator YesN